MSLPASLRSAMIQHWAHGATLSAEDWRVLKGWELERQERLIAFQIQSCDLEAVLAKRARLLQAVAPDFIIFCQHTLRLDQPLWETLWETWLPLAIAIAERQSQLQRVMIQGVLGGQGTGKTTLTSLLQVLLHHLGLRTVSLSLDDLYKTFQERQALSAKDPRLKWRGPPGTHDIALGLSVLTQLQQAKSDQHVALPRFDKALHEGAGDRMASVWVSQVDLVFFEGWFVGLQPIDPEAFTHPPFPIQTELDRQFARDMNQALTDYQCLWEKLDHLVILKACDYRLSKLWRQQAEQQLRCDRKHGMSDGEISEFVDFFWKALHPALFIPALLNQKRPNHLVIEVQRNHLPGRIWMPSDTK